MSDSHLSSHELAGYLSADLPQDERRRIETHLADCDECRAELVAVRRLTSTMTPAAKRRAPLVAGLVAAAVVAVLVIPWRAARQPDAGDVGADLQRPGVDAERESVEVVFPSAASSVVAGALTLIWRADSVGSTYRVRVTDDDGDVVWSATTRDTTVTVSDTTFARREAGTYYLYVDAQRANGFSVSSGVRRFEVRR